MMFRNLVIFVSFLSLSSFSMDEEELEKFEYLKSAADNGDVKAMLDLGQHYLVINNKEMALYYLEKCNEEQKHLGGNLYATVLIQTNNLRN